MTAIQALNTDREMRVGSSHKVSICSNLNHKWKCTRAQELKCRTAIDFCKTREHSWEVEYKIVILEPSLPNCILLSISLLLFESQPRVQWNDLLQNIVDLLLQENTIPVDHIQSSEQKLQVANLNKSVFYWYLSFVKQPIVVTALWKRVLICWYMFFSTFITVTKTDHFFITQFWFLLLSKLFRLAGE